MAAPPPSAPRALSLALSTAFAGLLSFAPTARANPQGAQVVQGRATLTGGDGKLTITNTPGAAINWQSFSIKAGETTWFNQESSKSSVLNRVVTNNPSQIFGTLGSNGRVVLVNESGITVGKGAVVDTAGFTASTLAMSDRDWAGGRMRFEATPGSATIQVDGSIRSANGDVVLLAPQVAVGGTGTVQASNGDVILAAGSKAEITGRGVEGIRFEVGNRGTTATNLGALQGDAVAVFAGTLRHSGSIIANTASVSGGRVVLAARGDAVFSGSVLATDAATSGGQVEVRAENIHMDGSAVIDVSGSSGGRVTLIAENAASLHGKIAADGVAAGGFIETSGKRTLDVSGIALSARGALPGTWLLDPLNIEVVTGSGTSGNSGPTAFTPTGSNSQIGASLITSQLNGGTNVVLNTSAPGSDAGNIVVSAPILKTAPNSASLSLVANNTININAPVDLTAGSLSLAAPNGSSIAANVTAAGLSTAGTLNLVNGTTNISGGSSVGTYNQTGGVFTGAGTLTVNNAFSQTGGNMTGTGLTVLAGAIPFLADGKVIDRNLAVSGLTTLNAGNTVTINGGKKLKVVGGLEAYSDFANGGTSSFLGNGTLEVPTGAIARFSGTDPRDVIFNSVSIDNAGTLKLDFLGNLGVVLNNGAVLTNQASGKILFNQPGNYIATTAGAGVINNFGTIRSASNNDIDLHPSNIAFNGGSVLDAGTGQVAVSAGSVGYAGSVTTNSELLLNGGAQGFSNGTVMTGTGSITQDGAAVTMNNVVLDVPYKLAAGNTLTIAAGKSVGINGGMDVVSEYAGGQPTSIVGGGALGIPSGSNLRLSGSNALTVVVDNVTIQNNGTVKMEFTGGDKGLVLSNGAVLDNRSGSQIVFNEPGNYITAGTGSGTLNNDGVVLMNNSGSAILGNTLTLNLNASSQLEVRSNGTLEVHQAIVNNGSIFTDNSTTFTTNGNAVTNYGTIDTLGTFSASTIQNNGSMSGWGTINATTLTNAGTVIPSGTLTLNGDYVQTSTGTMDITVINTGFYDRLMVSGSVSLAGYVTANPDPSANYIAGDTFDIVYGATSVSGGAFVNSGFGIAASPSPGAVTLFAQTPPPGPPSPPPPSPPPPSPPPPSPPPPSPPPPSPPPPSPPPPSPPPPSPPPPSPPPPSPPPPSPPPPSPPPPSPPPPSPPPPSPPPPPASSSADAVEVARNEYVGATDVLRAFLGNGSSSPSAPERSRDEIVGDQSCR